MTDDTKAQHDARMAELRGRWDSPFLDTAQMIHEHGLTFSGALAYADQLHEQLEAEREKRLDAEGERDAAREHEQDLNAVDRALHRPDDDDFGSLVEYAEHIWARLQAAEDRVRQLERTRDMMIADQMAIGIHPADPGAFGSGERLQAAESTISTILDGFDHSSVCMVGDNCPDGEHKPDCPLVTQGYVTTDGKRTAAGEALRGRPPPPPVPATTHELAVKVAVAAHRYRVAVAADRFHRAGPVTASVAEAWLALGEAVEGYDRGAAFRRIPMRSVVYRCKAHAAPGEVLTIGYVKATCAVCGVEFKPEDGGGPQWVDGYSEQAYDLAATGDDAGKENG